MMYDVPLLLRWAVDAKVIDSGVGQGLLRSSQLLNLGISTVYVLLLFFFFLSIMLLGLRWSLFSCDINEEFILMGLAVFPQEDH